MVSKIDFYIFFRCAGTETEAKCFESFDEYKFVQIYDCVGQCKNCYLCEGEDQPSVCQYCKPPEDCEKLCIAGKAKCCACDEAAGLCDDN